MQEGPGCPPTKALFPLSLDLCLQTPGPGLTKGGYRLLSDQKSLEALMALVAVLEGGKGPKVKTRKACGHPSVTGPKLEWPLPVTV